MANKLASVSVSCSYTDQDDQRAAIARANISAPYTAQSHNEIDIPDTEGAGSFDVDFGSVGTEATFVIVKNLTANGVNPGQDIVLSINASAALQRIPPGGMVAFANPVAAGGSPITEMTVTTLATQVGPGSVSTHVFGDPI